MAKDGGEAGMTDAGRPSRFDAGRHLLLYDGLCGLCDGFVRFVLTRDGQGRFRFAAIQSGVGRRLLAAHGKDPDRLDTVYVVVDQASATPRVLNRSAAALFVIDQLGWPWRAATLLRRVPTPLLDRLYDRVAVQRYRVFGRRSACPAPDPEHRDRFLDA